MEASCQPCTSASAEHCQFPTRSRTSRSALTRDNTSYGQSEFLRYPSPFQGRRPQEPNCCETVVHLSRRKPPPRSSLVELSPLGLERNEYPSCRTERGLR